MACAVAATVLYSTAHFVQAEENYKVTTEIPMGVAVPDKIETSIGTLNLETGILTSPDQLFYKWDGEERLIPA